MPRTFTKIEDRNFVTLILLYEGKHMEKGIAGFQRQEGFFLEHSPNFFLVVFLTFFLF